MGLREDYYQLYIKNEGDYECGRGGLGGIVFPCGAGWTREKMAELITSPSKLIPSVCFAIPTHIEGAGSYWLSDGISSNLKKYQGERYLMNELPWNKIAMNHNNQELKLEQ